jgi:hypothetical protein
VIGAAHTALEIAAAPQRKIDTSWYATTETVK